MIREHGIRPPPHAARTATLAFALTVLFAGTSPAQPSLSLPEVEPNDTLATAMGKGLIGLGSVTIADAMLGDGDHGELDVDIYFIVIDQSTPLPVLFTADVDSLDPDLDGFLRLFDATGVELQNNDDSAFDDADPRLRTYLLEAGVYFVGVSAAANPHYDAAVAGSGRAGTTGAYTLTLTTEEATFPESAFEPNDTLATATTMGGESFEIAGEFIGDGGFGRRDVDIFRLDLTGPARLDIEVQAECIGSPLDPVVQLEGVLAIADDAPDGSVDAVLSAGIPVAQEVFILVYGAGNPKVRSVVQDSGEPGSVGYYDLIVCVTYVSGGGSDEPNDSILLTTPTLILPDPRDPVEPQSRRYEGFVGDGPYNLTRGDRDFFQLSIYESGVVTADVTTASIGSELDSLIALYDRNGYRVAVNDSRSASRDAGLTFPFPCTNDYDQYEPDYVPATLLVMGTGQRFPNDPFVPWVTLESGHEPRYEEYMVGDGPGSTGAFELTITWSSADDACGLEPDDTLATATSTGIVDEGYYACTNAWMGDSSCLYPELDVDLWSLEVIHAPARLHVVVAYCRNDEEPLDQATIRVFDSAGVEVALRDPYDILGTPKDLSVVIPEPGTYYIGVTDASNYQYDPNVPCSGWGGWFGEYDILMTVAQGNDLGLSDAGETALAFAESSAEGDVLFATHLDSASNMIDLLDSGTGEVTGSFAAPEPRFGGAEGLAYDGADLFYVGVGRYPSLYRLDSHIGKVLDQYILWPGSGYYSDAVMVGGRLYLLDFYDRGIHVLDPIRRRFLRTLPVGSTCGTTIGGGLAALAGPNRLYVADAFNTGAIYEIDPVHGVRTNTLVPPTNRPVALAGVGTSTLYVGDWQSDMMEAIDRSGDPLDELPLAAPPGALAGQASIGFFADFDRDGDIDLSDFAALQLCFTGSAGEIGPGCGPGDRDADGDVDLSDVGAWPAAVTGP